MLGVAKLSRELVELPSLSRADCGRYLMRLLSLRRFRDQGSGKKTAGETWK